MFPSHLRMIENCKQSNACVHPGKDAKGVALSPPLVENKEVENAGVSQRGLKRCVLDDEASKMREKVVEALKLFQEIRTELLNEMKCKLEIQSGGINNRVNFRAAEAVQKMGKCVNVSKQLGPVCGVEVGDRFSCKVELKVIGLHDQFICGIDHMEKDGKFWRRASLILSVMRLS